MLYSTHISLDGQWTLYYAANKIVKKTFPKDALLTEAVLAETGFEKIPAQVPGNFELDMHRAGLIDDPFYACGTIEAQRFENLHLFYTRRFTLDKVDEDTFLCFDGIDTIADIFVNGQLVGKCDNMLIPWEFDSTGLRVGENEILIHITPAHIAARAYPLPVSSHHHACGYDSIWIRKAPHMYGWDIMPRALSGGIWRSCRVEQRLPDRIDDLFVYTHDLSADHKRGTFGFFWNLTVSEDLLDDYRLSIEGACGDSTFHWTQKRLTKHTASKCQVNVNDPKLWWPRHYGEANLYEIKATLWYKDQPVFEKELTAGLRTIELERTSITDEQGSGQFLFRINGKPIFWQGTNWVPVDAYHSRDKERLPQILPMLTDCECNCVRCWGGNVYEDDIFYEFCDKNGIMVWQDFSHACGINPQVPEYCNRFYTEVETIVKRLRNHTSIVLWAGDNEVDACYRWSGGYVQRDPNNNILTRQVIPQVLNAHDFTRPYLPSSPYIDEAAFAAMKGSGTEQGAISEGHLWGPRDYFKGYYYSHSICHFASETGYHGCPSPASLKKYIRPAQLWPWRKYPKDHPKYDVPHDDWTCHSASWALDGEDGCCYRIRLMTNQVKTLFTDFREDEAALGLDKYAMASQISQAEAKKYFIERFRVTKWRRTGIIWWNLIDGWPQISDAVVDYYGVKKLAYHYIKRSQAPLCFIFDEPKDGVLPLHAVSDLQSDVAVRFTVTDLVTGEELVAASTIAKNNASEVVYKKPMLPEEKHFYLIRWSYVDGSGNTVEGCNHFVTNVKDLELDTYLGWMETAGFMGEFSGFEE